MPTQALPPQTAVQSLKGDLYEYPAPHEIASYPENFMVSEGDLHGNTAKLLQLLIREGIIEMPLPVFK